jgi:hypothetical protein
MRTPLKDLVLVDDEEWIIRIIRPESYDHDAPTGMRVLTSALQSKEMPSTDQSYGPSVFVESKLPCSLENLESEVKKWGGCGVAKVQAKKLRELGIDVRFSPDDCEMPTIKPAHASLVGCTKPTRTPIIDLLGANMAKLPKRDP